MTFQRYEVACPDEEEYSQAEALSRARKPSGSVGEDRPRDDAETYLIGAPGKLAVPLSHPSYSCTSATVLAAEAVKISQRIAIDAVGSSVVRKRGIAFGRLAGALQGMAPAMRIAPPKGHGVSLYLPGAPSVFAQMWDQAYRQVSSTRPTREEAMHEIALERARYERRKEEIVAAYEGQYVAFINGEVVDHDADFGVLARRVYGRFGRRPMLLAKAVRSPQRSRIGPGLHCR